MAKKTTLDDIAKILTVHGKEIRDLAASVATSQMSKQASGACRSR